MEVDTRMLYLPSTKSLTVYAESSTKASPHVARTHLLLILLSETLVSVAFAFLLSDEFSSFKQARMFIQHILGHISASFFMLSSNQRTTISSTQARKEQNTMARVSLTVP
jgi:hypothetical protein